MNTVDSYTVRIWLAGDYDDARRTTRRFCANEGACFAITRADFIYTGGEESGVIVTLINYPRFPSKPDFLWDKAKRLAELLRHDLCQKSYSIEAPDKTEWVTTMPPAPEAAP